VMDSQSPFGDTGRASSMDGVRKMAPGSEGLRMLEGEGSRQRARRSVRWMDEECSTVSSGSGKSVVAVEGQAASTGPGLAGQRRRSSGSWGEAFARLMRFMSISGAAPASPAGKGASSKRGRCQLRPAAASPGRKLSLR
jgi:hypothetical protein